MATKKTIINFILFFFLLLSCKTAFAKTHPYFVREVSISPNGRYIGIGRVDYKLILCDRIQKKILKVVEGEEGRLSWNIVDFTPDSKYWVFQSYKDGKYNLNFYNMEQDTIEKTLDIGYTVGCMVFMGNNEEVILGGMDGRIELFNVKTSARKIYKKPIPEKIDGVKVGIGWEKPIQELCLSPDNKYLVSTTFSSNMAYADADWEDFELIRTWKTRDCGKDVTNGDFAIKHLGVNLWDVQTGKKIRQLLAPRLNGRTWACFSPDGKYVIATSENGGTTRFDVETGEKVMEYERFGTEGMGFTNSYGESYVTLNTHGYTPELILWNTNKEKALSPLKLSHDAVTGALATLPSQNLIITGDRDGSISAYKFNPTTQQIQLDWHPKPIASGIINWLNPLHLIGKNQEQIQDLQKRYEQAQKKEQKKDIKKNEVETSYDKIQVE